MSFYTLTSNPVKLYLQYLARCGHSEHTNYRQMMDVYELKLGWNSLISF